MASKGIIKYRKYQETRKNLATSGKWYAKAVQDRAVDFEAFVDHMSEHNSPYSRGVIHGVLIDMLRCLQELVLDGKSVRLGELGLVSLGMSTKPADSAEKFTVANITGVHLNVRNTRSWSNAELRQKCSLQELSAYTRGLPVEDPTAGNDPTPPARPGEVKPGEVKPGEVKPGEVKPGEVKPGEVKPGEVKPGEVKPGGDGKETGSVLG